MAITPGAGYQVDPNNPNGVVAIPGYAPTLDIPVPGSSAIPPAILGNTNPMALPPPPILSPYNVQGIPNGLAQTEQNIMALQNQGLATEQVQDDLSTDLLNATKALGTKTAATIREEDKAANALGSANGLSGFNIQLSDVNNQIQALQKEALAIPLQLQQDFTGKGATTGGVNPIQTGKLRENAIKSLTLSSIAQTLQGNINSAKSAASRAVDLEFEQKEAEINYLEKALEINESKMNREEKRRAENLQIELDERKRLLDIQKSDRKDIQELALNAIQNFPNDPNVMAEAQALIQSGDLDLAISRLSRYQKDPLAIEKAKLDLDNIRSQMRERELESKRADRLLQLKENESLTGGADGMTPDNLIAYAQQYASTGTIPTGLPKGTFGVVAQFAKEAPKQPGTIVDVNTGVRSSAASDAQLGAYGAVYSTMELAKQLKELDKERWGGLVSGTVGKVLGSEDQRKYIDLRSQIVDLLARARTGAALTAQEEAFYSNMLPGRWDEPLGIGSDSQVRIDNFINNLSADLENKTRSQGLSVYGLSKVDIGGKKYTVGDVYSNDKGQTGRVNPDGSITLISE